ncbi:PadR family transcriptional regulator [Nocardia yunnanensis]|uniref:PadR family transcriptional regulator n=1 Tax=Nocardia yunnanensis TaxID=2382165 RepID=A0A386ZKT0_9NOCA|nr:PadR family transcriptional regulator [Nocardia yunnanensis]AYF78028.1 PadR family transcriptional regulator [Nocardia yunnanensis]
MADFRMTTSVAKVLREFLEDPTARQYGFDLMKSCHIPSGSLYPILLRLEKAGWIVGHFEDIDPSTEGRPPRKYYTMTPEGALSATRELAKLSAALRPPTLAPVFNPGALGGLA